ncbi:hypothetical protein, partial [Klebsiella oxytoca]|uniref:hypothetical protein n=1 Tax=Klebsiella oxytoca TaxID=571 RepID=UPI001CCABC2D
GALRRPREKSAVQRNSSGGDAAYLSGLRVLSSLQDCSPGRRFAPPPGNGVTTSQAQGETQ